MSSPVEPGHNFLRTQIREDLESGRLDGTVVTRFPPEPNGYLHLGHAKAICLNFGLAEHFKGHCHLRFDDTNPEKESQEYIDAIQADIRWLGFEWHGPVRYASEYFDTLYEYAQDLVTQNLAYVCDLSAEQAREYRGTLKEAGRNSPGRERSVDENLDLLARMRAGEFDEGHCVLRAKIDMASPNMNLRDPILYRIRKAHHHQTGDRWCIYPTYDFAHGQSDAIEGITHSICTLEFEDHKPLYNWLVEKLPVPSTPHQFEFARGNINYTVTSKRKLKQLVDDGHVNGWDDPRMPTISGLRRRGYTAAAIRKFWEMVGVARADSSVDVAMLEHAIRDDLNENAMRAMCVLEPLKIVLTNFPADQQEWLEAPAHPNREELGTRKLPFSRELYIEQDDFRLEANKKYKRLVLGKSVRLRNAYVITAEDVVRNDADDVIEVHCRYDADTLGSNPTDGSKPKGVIHWVSASHGKTATVRIYDRLFSHPTPDRASEDFLTLLNPDSLRTLENCQIEPGLAEATGGQNFQFERQGYFVADALEHSSAKPVFNLTVGLRDSWAKIEAQGD